MWAKREEKRDGRAEEEIASCERVVGEEGRSEESIEEREQREKKRRGGAEQKRRALLARK